MPIDPFTGHPSFTREELRDLRLKYRGKKVISISKDAKGLVIVRLGTRTKYKPVMNRCM